MLSAGNKEDSAIHAALSADMSTAAAAMPAELSSIFRLIEDPCCILHSDGRMLAASNTFTGLLGILPVQLRQHRLSDWVHPEDCALLQRKLLLAKTKEHRYELRARIRCPRGNYQHYLLRLEATGGNLVLVLKNTEQPAGASLPYEQLTSVSLVYDKHFNLIRYNPQISQLLGYSEEELLLTDLKGLVHPGDLPRFISHARSLKRGLIRGFSCELQLKHRQQHWVWVQYSATLLESGGEEPYITALVLDISELKAKEARMEQEQKDMGMFIDRISHDLKGPLGSLMALYRIVELEFAHDPKVMEYFNHYQATVERLNTTVTDLLTLSRVKKATPRVGLVNVRNMVQDCLQSLCHLPAFYKITFTTRIEVKDSIYIEEHLLQTIIQNLLENAIKYCSEESPKVLICMKFKDNQLLLEVSDNGIGIPQDAQPRVFEMFYRATTRSTGTGLGLYILKNAVDKLQGTVKLRSLPHKGTHFLISIPYTAPLAEEIVS